MFPLHFLSPTLTLSAPINNPSPPNTCLPFTALCLTFPFTPSCLHRTIVMQLNEKKKKSSPSPAGSQSVVLSRNAAKSEASSYVLLSTTVLTFISQYLTSSFSAYVYTLYDLSTFFCRILPFSGYNTFTCK